MELRTRCRSSLFAASLSCSTAFSSILSARATSSGSPAAVPSWMQPRRSLTLPADVWIRCCRCFFLACSFRSASSSLFTAWSLASTAASSSFSMPAALARDIAAIRAFASVGTSPAASARISSRACRSLCCSSSLASRRSTCSRAASAARSSSRSMPASLASASAVRSLVVSGEGPSMVSSTSRARRRFLFRSCRSSSTAQRRSCPSSGSLGSIQPPLEASSAETRSQPL
mmetsp:Transcript_27272/g.81245  ORF Transcript_27272/g.81245 Transcript_27272/m.81245 type:complete len:230 (-) Transcript_27272:643-1332(-)